MSEQPEFTDQEIIQALPIRWPEMYTKPPRMIRLSYDPYPITGQEIAEKLAAVGITPTGAIHREVLTPLRFVIRLRGVWYEVSAAYGNVTHSLVIGPLRPWKNWVFAVEFLRDEDDRISGVIILRECAERSPRQYIWIDGEDCHLTPATIARLQRFQGHYFGRPHDRNWKPLRVCWNCGTDIPGCPVWFRDYSFHSAECLESWHRDMMDKFRDKYS